MKPSQKDGWISCACWNSHTTIEYSRNGLTLIAIAALMAACLVIPYATAMAKRLMPAFIPFISQSAGSPPMSGMFAVPMIIMAFIAIYPIILLYQSINHRNVKQSKKIRVANGFALATVFVGCFGCVVTVANPVGYTDVPNKFEWAVTVLYEHSMGAFMIFVGTAIYQFLLTYIWWLLPDVTKTAKYIKLFFSAAYILLFIICSKTIPDTVQEELGPEPLNMELLKSTTYELPVVYSVSYKISAFSEWAVCILSALNYLSLFGDLQRITFRAVIKHKSCYKVPVEPVPSIDTVMTLKIPA